MLKISKKGIGCLKFSSPALRTQDEQFCVILVDVLGCNHTSSIPLACFPVKKTLENRLGTLGQAEVTDLVKKTYRSRAPGVDEISPEFLKTLDVVGWCWLTCLCYVTRTLGTVSLDWQTRGGVPQV